MLFFDVLLIKATNLFPLYANLINSMKPSLRGDFINYFCDSLNTNTAADVFILFLPPFYSASCSTLLEAFDLFTFNGRNVTLTAICAVDNPRLRDFLSISRILLKIFDGKTFSNEIST